MSNLDKPRVSWRLSLYELLTQAIVLLGTARARLMRHQRWRRAPGRVFAVYNDERWSCCDCGLEHDQIHFAPAVCPDDHASLPEALSSLVEVAHAWPLRPAGYAYRLRVGAEPPSLATDTRARGKETP